MYGLHIALRYNYIMYDLCKYTYICCRQMLIYTCACMHIGRKGEERAEKDKGLQLMLNIVSLRYEINAQNHPS